MMDDDGAAPSLAALATLAARLRSDARRVAGDPSPADETPTSELLAVLIGRYFRYDAGTRVRVENDQLILASDPSGALATAVARSLGMIAENEAAERPDGNLASVPDELSGAATAIPPMTDVAGGISVAGRGLSAGFGLAVAGRHVEHRPYRIWVFCRDIELTDDSNWTSIEHAAALQLSNLIMIIDRADDSDVRRRGRRPDVATIRRRAEAFGAHVIVVDAHDLAAVDRAFARAARRSDQITGPTMIMTDPRSPEDTPSDRQPDIDRPAPSRHDNSCHTVPRHHSASSRGAELVDALTAHRQTLRELQRHDPHLLGFDADDTVRRPQRLSPTGLSGGAEPDVVDALSALPSAQLIAIASALAARGSRVFVCLPAAALPRIHDAIAIAAGSAIDLRLVGAAAGIAVEIGSTRSYALGDLAMMRAMDGSTVLQASDATSAAALTRQLVTTPGISYLRMCSRQLPILYPSGDAFPIGGSKIIRSGPEDQVTLIGSGITAYECLLAKDILDRYAIRARVIDCYSIKPIDTSTIASAARATAGRVVIAEDHVVEGGLSSAVGESLLAVRQSPLSVITLAVHAPFVGAQTTDPLALAGIDADHIARAAYRLATAPL